MTLKSYSYLLLIMISVLSSCKEDDSASVYKELIDTVNVEYNPTGIAPLSAEVTIRTSLETDLTLEVDGNPAILYSSSQDTVHSIVIHGLQGGFMNHLLLRVGDMEGNYDTSTISILTDPLPSLLPEVIVDVSSSVQFYFLEAGLCEDGTSIGYPMIIDSDGQVRWYLMLSELGIITLPMTRLENGNFITSKQDSLFEIDMLGRIVNGYKLSGHSVHHDIQETSDGNYIILTSKSGVSTIEDFMVEYDPDSRAIVKEWDLGSILDISRHDISMNDFDWLHANSVQYIEERDVFIISGRHQGIFEMSYEGELNWILAPHKNWGTAGRDGLGEDLNSKLLTAIDENDQEYPLEIQLGNQAVDNFDWSWAQHGAFMDGNYLYCFDNGWLRQFNETGVVDGIGRGVKYEIDRQSLLVKEEWAYSGSGNELYSFAMGDIDLISKDEVLVLSSLSATPSGTGARILEINTETNRINTDISVRYKNQNCIPDVIFGSFDFIYQGGRFSFEQ